MRFGLPPSLMRGDLALRLPVSPVTGAGGNITLPTLPRTGPIFSSGAASFNPGIPANSGILPVAPTRAQTFRYPDPLSRAASPADWLRRILAATFSAGGEILSIGDDRGQSYGVGSMVQYPIADVLRRMNQEGTHPETVTVEVPANIVLTIPATIDAAAQVEFVMPGSIGTNVSSPAIKNVPASRPAAPVLAPAGIDTTWGASSVIGGSRTETIDIPPSPVTDSAPLPQKRNFPKWALIAGGVGVAFLLLRK